MPRAIGPQGQPWSSHRPAGPAALGATTARKAAWVWPVAVLATAVVGGLATPDAPAFYEQLDRPAWAPPAGLFGPAWGALYLLMAVAAYRVANADGPSRRTALGVFALQLVANAAWSWLFFGLHQGALALGGAVVLLALVLASAVLFHRVRRASGWMLAPSVVWVSFATALTASVWMRNPALLAG